MSDFIVESVTCNNEWYRKYSDGWIEQGGCAPIIFKGGTRATYSYTFPVPFTSAPVSLDTTILSAQQTDGLAYELCVTSLTATGFTALIGYPNYPERTSGVFWRAKGK